jgi:CheY-like chemotaxis protein
MSDDLILIVDNDPVLRATVAEVLEDCGFRTATAANGLQALHAIAKEEPSIVLLDMRMPMLDGKGFVERLREFGRSPGIIVMSGSQPSAEELADMGAVAFVGKPFEVEDLVRRIQTRTSARPTPKAPTRKAA